MNNLENIIEMWKKDAVIDEMNLGEASRESAKLHSKYLELYSINIWISAPVCGLRPVRAARSLTEKVPKPTNATELPSFSEEVTAPVNASSARVAAALEISASVEIFSTS